MRRSKRWLCLLSLMVALAIAGCNHKTVYHHYEHTPLAGWEKNDTLVFCVPAIKQRAVIQREVELRISGEFPFQNIYLIVEYTTQPSHISRRDTVNCSLITKQGKILGDGLSLYHYRFHLPDISVNEDDSLQVCIRHNMKREILPGVAGVGLKLTAY